ncbi:MAG: hypothetical protein IK132_12225 [Clostridia bacterium]|nr:hypothetical protein [Clostridia bacterium]
MRGTTPTHTFRVPIDLTSAAVLKVYYKQGYEVLVEKEKPDLVVTPSTITVQLTQEETLRFADGQIKMQIRAKMPNGKAVKSKVKTTSADELLKNEVI